MSSPTEGNAVLTLTPVTRRYLQRCRAYEVQPSTQPIHPNRDGIHYAHQSMAVITQRGLAHPGASCKTCLFHSKRCQGRSQRHNEISGTLAPLNSQHLNVLLAHSPPKGSQAGAPGPEQQIGVLLVPAPSRLSYGRVAQVPPLPAGGEVVPAGRGRPSV